MESPPRPQTLRVIQSTPPQRKLSGSQKYLTKPATAMSNRRDMAREMEGRWVGPMPLEDFLDDFLPLSASNSNVTRPQVEKTHFSDLKFTSETQMYTPIVNLINDLKDVLPSDYRLVNTSNHPDKDSKPGHKVRIDLAHYKGIDVGDRPTQLGGTILGYELKLGEAGDIIDEKCGFSGPFERLAKAATFTRGQLATYATEICARQHRNHFFMIFLFHPFIRFIRWDRAGAILTEKFKYTEDCGPLIEFLWRFGLLDAAGQGVDTTVQPATDEEVQHAKRVLKDWQEAVNRDVVKMEVPDGVDKRYFLVWGALAEPLSPIGRATRGFPAVEVKKGILDDTPMFLKEQWRSSSVESEVKTLQELNAKEVINVPTFVCGGELKDVADATKYQTTITQKYAKASWRIGNKRLETRIHIRFVVKEVGIPLERFPSSKIMFQAVRDAFLGHQDAYEKCGFLHRDVSGGNILIINTPNGMKGILNDWDLAKKERELADGARDHERTGTWPFMSVRLLQNPTRVHTVHDDLESFFWVVLYHGLFYLPHNHADQIETLIQDIFNHYSFAGPNNQPRGGNGKSVLLNDGGTIGIAAELPLQFTNCPPLTRFVVVASKLLASWHRRDIRARSKKRQARAIMHNNMRNVWEDALNSAGWPVDDAAENQFALLDSQKHVKRTSISGSSQDEENGVLTKRIKLTAASDVLP